MLILGACVGLSMEFGVYQKWCVRPSFGWEVILIFIFLTGIIFLRLTRTPTNHFIQVYLATLVLKLLVGGILISIIFWLDRKLANENAVIFVINYLAFTSLEVLFLFKRFNPPEKTFKKVVFNK
jgi:hypothetical protein